MRCMAVEAAVVGILLVGSAVCAGPPAPLEPLAFLIGEWEATGAGPPGQGSGRAVFSRALQDRVILRTSYSEFPASGGAAGSRHDDLVVIYAVAGTGARADYYDNEDHVIHYAVNSPAVGEAVFVSESMAGEPRFRLSYKLTPDGILRGEFAIAPPGEPPAFKPYLAWESRRVKASAPRSP
jgi:hypothetical protein